MADVIKWDKPLNDEEGIQWENTLTEDIASTPYQLQTHSRGRDLNQTQPYTPEQPITQMSGTAANLGLDPMQPTGNYSQRQLGAAQQGVNIDANAGVSTYRANFAAKKEQRDAIVAQSIKDKYGPDTPVRTGADSLSGDVEWYDPDARQWKVAGDSSSGAIPNAIPAAGEIAGGVGGAFLPAPGVSSAVGAGVGRGAGQAIKNLIGRQMGVEEDVRDQPSAAAEGLKAGALAGAGNILTSGVPAGWRMLTKGKDVVNPETAQAILNSYKKNSSMVDDINNALAGRTNDRLTLSTARVAATPDSSGRIDPAAANLSSREPQLITIPEIADRERTRRLANENVLELYWQHAVNDPQAFQNINQSNWQTNLKKLYDDAHDQQLGPYQKQAEAKLAEAEQAAQKMPQMGELDATSGGQLIRDTIIEASKASKGKETAAWANYEEKAGYKTDGFGSDLKVPITEKISGTMASLKALKKQALLNTQKSQADRYTLNVPEALSEEDSALLKDFDVESSGGTMDLAVLDRTIKDLRKEGSQALRGQVAGDISDANRGRLLNNLVEARKEFIEKQGPELQTALSEAEAETARHHAEFDRSFVGQFLVHDSAYELHVADPNILDKIMQNKDKLGAIQLAGLVQGVPGAKKAIIDYVNAYYNKHYTKMLPDGTRILNAAEHAKFKEDVLPYIKPFLDKADQAQLAEYGGIGKAVLRSQQRYEAAVEAWKKTDSGKLGQKLTNETFVSQFFDPKKSFADSNLTFIKKNLEPGALEKTRSGIMSEITSRSRNAETGRIDVNKLAGVIAPIKERMTNYFGKETVENIDKFIKASQAMQREFPVTAPRPTGATALGAAAKFYLGPLNTEGYRITQLGKLRVRSYAARLEAALYDPKELPRLIEEINSRRGRTALKSAAGVTVLSIYDN